MRILLILLNLEIVEKYEITYLVNCLTEAAVFNEKFVSIKMFHTISRTLFAPTCVLAMM